MMALQERWEKNEARKAFNNALADAKAEIKPITKNRRVKFEAKNGGADVDYEHEDIAGIADAIDPILSKHGLFYHWAPTNDYASGMVTVTCLVKHRLGHEQLTTLSAKIDTSGSKNHLQAICSAVTYLERYTLKAALGLAAAHDDDGQAAGMDIKPDPGRSRAQQRAPEQPQPPAATITATQAADLNLKLEKAKPKGIDMPQFWVFARASKVEDIAAERYPTVLSALASRYGV
jgi:hypothetical protein